VGNAVEWKPFCNNTSCPCMEPDPKPCEEFIDVRGNDRCGRCGWPPNRHAPLTDTEGSEGTS
jgi:hypothetical protein